MTINPNKRYIQYGCGLAAPEGWINFDASPTLRVQKIPLVGKTIVKFLHPVIFPDNVKYGDIIAGLPGIEPESCDGIYCSHVLEHLARNYVNQLDQGEADASLAFIRASLMGQEKDRRV